MTIMSAALKSREFVMNVIEIKDLHFAYNEQEPVLKGLSLTVKEGEFLAVIGKNASGKSTLARLINGLISPLSGEITVLDMDARKKENLYEIRKNVGIVFQNPDNQMVASIVEDDIVFGPENVGVPREEIAERLEFALKETGTGEFRESMASRLSGGQKQRVAIAGVLAIKPKILILDESTSMLDPKGREEVMEVVKKLNREEKMTVITITHYMDEVTGCDRVALLNNGVIEKTGTPQEIFEDEELLKRSGMEPPVPMKISLALKNYDVNTGLSLDKETLLNNLLTLATNN